MDLVEVELDSRGRATLRGARHTRYLMRQDDDGTLVLSPALVITQAELELRSRPDLVAEMEQAMADPSTMIRRGRPVRHPER